MILTIEQIEEFFDFGLNKLKDVEYMLMVRDSFNGEYYPVYIRKSDDYDEVVVEHNQNMQRVVECYDLTLPKEGQIVTGHNVWHGPDQRNQAVLAAQVEAARPKMTREEIISFWAEEVEMIARHMTDDPVDERFYALYSRTVELLREGQ